MLKEWSHGRPVTSEARIPSQLSRCGIYGGQSDTGTGISEYIDVIRQYDSISISYQHILTDALQSKQMTVPFIKHLGHYKSSYINICDYHSYIDVWAYLICEI